MNLIKKLATPDAFADANESLSSGSDIIEVVQQTQTNTVKFKMAKKRQTATVGTRRAQPMKKLANDTGDFGYCARLLAIRKQFKEATKKVMEQNLKQIKSEYMQSKHCFLDRLEAKVMEIGEAKQNHLEAMTEKYFETKDRMQALMADCQQEADGEFGASLDIVSEHEP